MKLNSLHEDTQKLYICEIYFLSTINFDIDSLWITEHIKPIESIKSAHGLNGMDTPVYYYVLVIDENGKSFLDSNNVQYSYNEKYDAHEYYFSITTKQEISQDADYSDNSDIISNIGTEWKDDENPEISITVYGVQGLIKQFEEMSSRDRDLDYDSTKQRKIMFQLIDKYNIV